MDGKCVRKGVVILLVFLVLLPFTVFAGGEGESTEEAKENLVIGVAVANLQADFHNKIQSIVKKLGEADGHTVIIADAKGDSALQISQVQDLLTRGIDVLVYIPAGASAASVPVRLADEAGIPVICVDRYPPDLRGDTFIASDSVESTRILAEWVIEQTGGVGKVAIIHGQMGTTPQVDRLKGWNLAMEKAPGLEVVAEQSADWDQTLGFTVAQDMLQRHPEITVIFGQCDTMAMGAARAVELANLDHEVLVVGFDGDEAALPELQRGLFDATCTQQVQGMGRLAYESALRAVAGEELPADQLLIAPLTTAENVAEFIESHP